MKILSLGYLGFETTKVTDWETFGPEVMALSAPRSGADGSLYFKMDDRKFRLAVHPGKIDRLSYIGWELADAHAFDDAIATLERKRVPYEIAAREQLNERGVTGMASFTDPAGFPHEVFYGQAFWPRSFVPGRPISGFLTRDQLGIGHVVVGVPEFKDEYRAFATEVLGFRIFAGYPVRMPEGHTERLEFYKCNERTHVLGYVPFKGLKGVEHIGIDMLHLDDVGACQDICEKRQVPIYCTLGRNVMDDTVSFYFRTPTGFIVEMGWGPRLEKQDAFVSSAPAGYPHIWGHKYTPENEATTLLPVK